jgi:acetyl-CoA acetyltransferase
MSEYTTAKMPPSTRANSRKAAIVGVGESDYRIDYKAARARKPGYEPPTLESLVATAFERALADSGLTRADIDGLSVSYIYGGPTPQESAGILGLEPRYMIQNGGLMAGPLPIVCADIAAGKADTVVMIYAAASRAINRQYGGATYGSEGGTPKSYYYYHPWGWSSQAAHWALITQRYLATYGATEENLGAVAMQLRKNAAANPNAVMQTPMTIEDYMRARYIVRPLRLFDMCLVNDGAVCLIVRRADMASDLPHRPVLVAGWGEAKVKTDKMRCLVGERLRPQMQEAAQQALDMAGMALSDIGHLEGYDPASIHLVNQVEGYGFTEPGTGLAAFKKGDLAPDGRLLGVNTAGGTISGAYMHGWNQIVEVVHQLRHDAGMRQVPGVQASMSSLAQTDQIHPIIYTRGG